MGQDTQGTSNIPESHSMGKQENATLITVVSQSLQGWQGGLSRPQLS